MTDIISVGPGAVATQVIAEGDGETLVINTGPATVFFGDHNAIRALDGSGIVPITPNSYFAVSGDKDLFACVLTGQLATLNIISGGLNFFLPVTSLTIPYGATGQRITINPPAFPGSIVGYNPAGLIEFIISPNGYLIYDATGGAFQHLFIAIQNASGTDSFGNPFQKGIQVGPQTGPQVLLAGGNPAYIAWPLNDSAFTSQPSIFSSIIGSGATRFAQVVWNSALTPITDHDDWVYEALNSPNADGSSSANAELGYYDANGVPHAWTIWDRGGMAFKTVQQLTAADPSITPTSLAPAQPESWRDLRPLTGSFVGTISGQYPPQYRKCADGDVELFGRVQMPPTAGNFNGITWGTLLPPYRPNHTIQVPITAVADGAATPVVSITPSGQLQFAFLPASVAGSTVIGIDCRYPLDSTGIIQS